MEKKQGVTDIRSSFFGGLNRDDVTGYIQQLQEKIGDLDEESVLLKAEIEDLKKRLNNAEIFYTALWNNCESLKQTMKYQEELIQHQKLLLAKQEKELSGCQKKVQKSKKENKK